jgi:hypothetical protein
VWVPVLMGSSLPDLLGGGGDTLASPYKSGTAQPLGWGGAGAGQLRINGVINNVGGVPGKMGLPCSPSVPPSSHGSHISVSGDHR